MLSFFFRAMPQCQIASPIVLQESAYYDAPKGFLYMKFIHTVAVALSSESSYNPFQLIWNITGTSNLTTD